MNCTEKFFAPKKSKSECNYVIILKTEIQAHYSEFTRKSNSEDTIYIKITICHKSS